MRKLAILTVTSWLSYRKINENLFRERRIRVKLIRFVFLCLVAFSAGPVFAQDQQPDQNMQILLDKVKADKKLLVAANMELSDAEGKAFWPIYDAYQKDLQGINDRLGKAILAYADAYNKKSLTDAQAKQLTAEVLAIDQDELTLRKTYAARLERAIPAMKAARYLQIENKIRAALRYDLAKGIPLVP
jgi:hypothetical protein